MHVDSMGCRHSGGLPGCTQRWGAATGSQRRTSAHCGVDNPDGSRNEGLIPRNRRNRALLRSLAARLGQTSTPAVDAVPDPAPTVDEPPDTDPMTDAQRRETLALVEATYEQVSRDAITEAFRSR